MDKQAVFNKVATALLAQNCTSIGSHHACRYRGYNNTRCAIGVLLPDDMYDSSWEGYGVQEILGHNEHSPLAKALGIEDGADIEFLCNLQSAHDGIRIGIPFDEQLRQRMSVVATQWHIDDDVLYG